MKVTDNAIVKGHIKQILAYLHKPVRKGGSKYPVDQQWLDQQPKQWRTDSDSQNL